VGSCEPASRHPDHHGDPVGLRLIHGKIIILLHMILIQKLK